MFPLFHTFCIHHHILELNRLVDWYASGLGDPRVPISPFHFQPFGWVPLTKLVAIADNANFLAKVGVALHCEGALDAALGEGWKARRKAEGHLVNAGVWDGEFKK
jgi:hypothetical protein